MFTGKVLRQALDKFMKGEVAANARVQVILPNGDFYDITGVKLLENKELKIIGEVINLENEKNLKKKKKIYQKKKINLFLKNLNKYRTKYQN